MFTMKRYAGFLLLCMTCGLVAAPTSASGPDFSGHWVLNEDESDDPRDALKGLTLMRQSTRADDVDEPGYRSGGADRRYFSQQELLAKRRAENAMVDVGPIQQILDARVVDITDSGGTASIRYDAGHVRELKPTEGGPVYSAKGGEYKADSLGLELSYRRDGLLFIETMLKPRGRMLEEFKLDAGGRQLTITTLIDNPDWIIEARLRRVFARDAAP